MIGLASDDMPLEAPELVRLAMTATGSTTPTELARALRMSNYTAPRNIKRWLDGESQPEFDATLVLLGAAGLLRPVDDAQPEPAAAGDLEPVLRAVRALDRKIDTSLTPRFDRLERDVRALARADARRSS